MPLRMSIVDEKADTRCLPIQMSANDPKRAFWNKLLVLESLNPLRAMPARFSTGSEAGHQADSHHTLCQKRPPRRAGFCGRAAMLRVVIQTEPWRCFVG